MILGCKTFCFNCYAGEISGVNSSGVMNRSVSVDPTGRSEGFSAVIYNNTNGLPTSEANAIAETDDGFIWIGSYAGLIRYDGDNFERMDSTTGISNVRCLYVDSRQRLWSGTNDSGVFAMKWDELLKWDKKDGLKSASIRAICEDGDGYIYIGTASGFASVDKDMNMTVLEDERVSESTIVDLRRGADGLVYGLTAKGDIFTLKGGEITSYLKSDEYPADGVTCILPDPEHPGYIYFGAEGAQVYYGDLLNGNLSSATVRSIDPLSEVQSLEYINGQVWVCSRTGIGNLDERDFHMLSGVPMNNSIGHVLTDYEGNLWFTSTRQGVMKIVPNQFSDMFDRYGLQGEVVNATCLYGDQMFIGTDNGLIVIEDEKPVESIPLDRAVSSSGRDLRVTDLIAYLKDIRIRSIIRDSKGRLWISTWRSHGLIRYDKGEIVTFTPGDGMLSERTRMISECDDGTVISANSGGISIIDGDSVTACYGERSGLKIKEILTAVEGYNHEKLLGSDGGGIYVIERNGIRHIGTDEGLKSEVILRIKRSRNNDFYWIITGNSIAYMTKDLKVNTIKQFPYPNNYDIYENSRGDAWILASDGIYVVKVEELLANGEIDPVHYSISSGLPYVATANSYNELTEDGDLYISGASGVIKVNIETPFDTVDELKMSVPFVDADGRRIYPDDEGSFTVPSKTHKLTVSSFVYNYTLMDPQVTYYLQGFDRTGTTVKRSELVPVDYTNLRGGSYDFVIRVSDAMGRGNREISVRIVKEKSFYEQIWFYAVCALLILLLAAACIRWYMRRKMTAYAKREEEQKKISRLFEQTATALVNAIDAKDKYTHGHSSRVADYSKRLAELLGKNEQECNEVYYAALLHDVGKIGIPNHIINKDGKLTDEEYAVIRQHPGLGAQILRSITEYPFLSLGANYHHERYDGRGYPDGLKGTDIPEIARIVSVADAYDAMTSKRSYRDPIPQQKVREELIKGSGTQFDPDIAKQMQQLIDLDTGYDMQEKEDEPDRKEELISDIHRSEVSEGIAVTDHMTTIRLRVSPFDGSRAPVPSVILFDSLDARFHDKEFEIRDLLYFEYGEIWFDGNTETRGARLMKTELKDTPYEDIRGTGEYFIEAVRIKDHVLIRIHGSSHIAEITVALPDSARFSYIGLTGESCRISDVVTDIADDVTDPDYIPRIAEEITYIDVPQGDIPNVQINGYRTDSSDGIPLKDSMSISFHMMSLPTARLVWHCAYLVIYTSDDGKVNGANYKEYALIRPDGESWEPEGLATNELTVSKMDSFMGWDVWKETNRAGYDSEVFIERKGNVVTVTTENQGIAIKSVTTILAKTGEIYAALTGDQCAITNIRIHS